MVGFSKVPMYKVGLTMLTPPVVEITWDNTGEPLQQCLAHSKASVLLTISIPGGLPFNKTPGQQEQALLESLGPVVTICINTIFCLAHFLLS